jgi:hypothetical protein
LHFYSLGILEKCGREITHITHNHNHHRIFSSEYALILKHMITFQENGQANTIIFNIQTYFVPMGVKEVVCGPEGTHLAGGCVLSKLG